jgi:ERF superfamily protein
MNQSEKLDLLFAALSRVQSELQGAKKDAENPYFKSKYADLASCWDAVRLPLTKNGLCVIQRAGVLNNEAGLFTLLGHSSGQWMEGFLPLNMKAKDPQAQGSAITYARRYSLAAIIGLVQTDDDGEAAMNRGRIAPEQPMEGDGVQPQGVRLPQLQKGAIDILGFNPSGSPVSRLHLTELHKIIKYLDEKYQDRPMPAKTQELHEMLIGRAMELEQGEIKDE